MVVLFHPHLRGCYQREHTKVGHRPCHPPCCHPRHLVSLVMLAIICLHRIHCRHVVVFLCLVIIIVIFAIVIIFVLIVIVSVCVIVIFNIINIIVLDIILVLSRALTCRRSQPIISPELWSQYQTLIDQKPYSNNAVEGEGLGPVKNLEESTVP